MAKRQKSHVKPTDLRGILQYIPKFRDRIFVISIDGAIVSDENFANLLLDFAVLRSLNIRVALVHGAASQIAALAAERGVEPSDLDGTEPVNEVTLELALTAANRLTHEILEGFTANGLRGVSTNAVTAHPRGIIDGIDYWYAGKAERIDLGHLEGLLAQGNIPVIPPLGFDREGNTYRVNSDDLAREVAVRLKATKLIYVTTRDGLIRNGEVIRQIPNGELDQILEHEPASLQPEQLAKARNSATACRAGIPRVHLINGSVHEGLLAEVFSNTGRCQCPGQCESDRAVFWQHLFADQLRRLTQAAAVVRHESLVDQVRGRDIAPDTQRVQSRIIREPPGTGLAFRSHAPSVHTLPAAGNRIFPNCRARPVPVSFGPRENSHP